MKTRISSVLLLAVLVLAGCKPDAALKKGEVIDNGTQPINAPPTASPKDPPPVPPSSSTPNPAPPAPPPPPR